MIHGHDLTHVLKDTKTLGGQHKVFSVFFMSSVDMLPANQPLDPSEKLLQSR